MTFLRFTLVYVKHVLSNVFTFTCIHCDKRGHFIKELLFEFG